MRRTDARTQMAQTAAPNRSGSEPTGNNEVSPKVFDCVTVIRQQDTAAKRPTDRARRNTGNTGATVKQGTTRVVRETDKPAIKIEVIKLDDAWLPVLVPNPVQPNHLNVIPF